MSPPPPESGCRAAVRLLRCHEAALIDERVQPPKATPAAQRIGGVSARGRPMQTTEMEDGSTWQCGGTFPSRAEGPGGAGGTAKREARRRPVYPTVARAPPMCARSAAKKNGMEGGRIGGRWVGASIAPPPLPPPSLSSFLPLSLSFSFSRIPYGGPRKPQFFLPIRI